MDPALAPTRFAGYRFVLLTLGSLSAQIPNPDPVAFRDYNIARSAQNPN